MGILTARCKTLLDSNKIAPSPPQAFATVVFDNLLKMIMQQCLIRATELTQWVLQLVESNHSLRILL